MALTPEEELEFQELQRKIGKRESFLPAALKTLASPGTSLGPRYLDVKRILGGENPADVAEFPTYTPNPLNAIQGLSQGFFGAFNPYLQGGAKTVVDAITGNPSTLDQNIEASKALSQSAQEDNPIGFAGGQGLGMVFNPVSRLMGGATNHPILGSGLMSILQGQYQLPLDASANDRLNNAILSGAVGTGIPLAASIPGKLANILFGSPKAGQYLQGNTAPTTSTENLLNQVKSSQSGIGNQISQRLENAPPVDVSSALTPKMLFNEALRLERGGASPAAIEPVLKAAAELEKSGGTLPASIANELKSSFYGKANYNVQGIPSITEKSQNAKFTSGLLRSLIGGKVPLQDLNQTYGAGEKISKSLEKLVNTPNLQNGAFNALSNLINREVGVPLISLLNNTTTGPAIGALLNPRVSSAVSTALIKKISE